MTADHRQNRRRFVQGAGVVGLGLLAGCGRLPFQPKPGAQQPRSLYRVGFLASAAATGPGIFRDALSELGYVEGQNLTLEIRLETETGDEVRQARELVELPVDVIVTSTMPAARAASDATSTIPIVNAGIVAGDLVEAGLAESLARPGGNVTGLSIP